MSASTLVTFLSMERKRPSFCGKNRSKAWDGHQDIHSCVLSTPPKISTRNLLQKKYKKWHFDPFISISLSRKNDKYQQGIRQSNNRREKGKEQKKTEKGEKQKGERRASA